MVQAYSTIVGVWCRCTVRVWVCGCMVRAPYLQNLIRKEPMKVWIKGVHCVEGSRALWDNACVREASRERGNGGMQNRKLSEKDCNSVTKMAETDLSVCKEAAVSCDSDVVVDRSEQREVIRRIPAEHFE